MTGTISHLRTDKKCPVCGSDRVYEVHSNDSDKGEHYWQTTEVYLHCHYCFTESDHWRKNRSWKKKLRKRWNDDAMDESIR